LQLVIRQLSTGTQEKLNTINFFISYIIFFSFLINFCWIGFFLSFSNIISIFFSHKYKCYLYIRNINWLFIELRVFYHFFLFCNFTNIINIFLIFINIKLNLHFFFLVFQLLLLFWFYFFCCCCCCYNIESFFFSTIIRNFSSNGKKNWG
jgi:hypothetical protein